jgi:hypothetical protein
VLARLVRSLVAELEKRKRESKFAPLTAKGCATQVQLL